VGIVELRVSGDGVCACKRREVANQSAVIEYMPIL